MKKRLLCIAALTMALASCNKDKPTSETVGFGGVDNIEDLKVPSSFNWSSSNELMTDISVVGIEGIAKGQVRIDIYDKDPYAGGEILFSSFTNSQGVLEAPVKLKSSIKEVVVVANTLGIGGNRITASVTGSTLRAHFSGVPQPRVFDKHSAASGSPVPALNFPNDNVYYLGGFNANGVPNNLEPADVITQPYLDALALALPEKNHLPCDDIRKNMLNDLFCSQVTTSKDDAEVFVTFVTEGAGYANALAYYYYPAGSPPASAAAIDSIFVIFPNATETGANLHAGDKVKLGTFPKNTSIAWVLLGNTWNQSVSEVEYGHYPSSVFSFFGHDDLNVDMGVEDEAPGVCADPTFNKHMLSFTDNINGKDIQLFTFEDINYPYGDYDFNDCVFYASGDLIPSCAPELGLPAGAIVDNDGDGIIDQYDDEPGNPNVACLIDFEGTLVFEDLWPSKGDYDFNDKVVGYSITHAIHAMGYVHEVRANYELRAAGAGYNNGFGIKLSDDLVKSDITSITGGTTGTFLMDGDLTATPGADLVMYNWDAADDIIIQNLNVGSFFNTVIGGGKGDFVAQNILISLAPGMVDPWELGLPPYNTFIFANQQQDVEIHLANMDNSSLHNTALFGTGDDDSDGITRFYKTIPATNLPWALDIPSSTFEWPLEKVDILTAYPEFSLWASSGGVMNTTWYDNPAAGQTYIP
ncbi:LruC domain-containing protein [Xanthomarina gelatinilytica]|uniref:LruC domain-containing protein n=1 Tax=Xanthomarina gelatinilytica TaxID=1137281 RepID=UPI003AA81CC6